MSFSVRQQKLLILQIDNQAVTYSLSKHLLLRLAQRGINHDMIRCVIEFGEAFFKQGLIFYVLGKNARSMDSSFDQSFSKCRNTVVLISHNNNSIITCYRNNNPHRYIKKKSKRLTSNLNNFLYD